MAPTPDPTIGPAPEPHRSILARALASDFDRLHPQLQQRLGVTVRDGVARVGRGVVDEVWRGRPVVAPFLRFGTRRNLLFPETGRDVPFTIENYPYLDDHGRETVSFVRTFEVAPGRRRRFEASMVLDTSRPGRRPVVVDYLGTYQHIAVVREHWDERDACFRIRVEGHHDVVGPVFGYHGRFTTTDVDVSTMPAALRPYREQPRV